MAFDPHDPNIIVAGGRSSGVFITSDGGRTGAADQPAHAYLGSRTCRIRLRAIRPRQARLVRVYLGTGRGVWRIGLVNADMAVTKADAPDPVIIGRDLTYTVLVSNGGPDMAQNATFEDDLPHGTTFRSISAPAGWSCDVPAVGDAGTVRCTNPSMAPGSASFSLVVRLGGSVSLGGVVNTARVYSAAIDHDLSDNAATTTTAVIVPVAINIQPKAPKSAAAARRPWRCDAAPP